MRFLKFGSVRFSRILPAVAAFIFIVYAAAYPLNARLKSAYTEQFSSAIFDRAGARITLNPNSRGYYAEDVGILSDSFIKLLVAKEDRFFYYHPGINPVSILRDGLQALFSGKLRGSSTLTQQLVKTLLGNENQRTIKNKIIEAFYTLALELYTPKDQILAMYANTAYFGNQIQGIKEASLYYYGRPPEILNNIQILELLSALNNPSVRYPGTYSNKEFTAILADKLGIDAKERIHDKQTSDNSIPYARKTSTSFETGALNANCRNADCTLTIDASLTESLRNILQTNLDSLAFQGVDNGAIVVVKLSKGSDDNELLAIVGTPDPSDASAGKQINMALEPRPIGSTAKPFIYAKAFEKGARPHTLVDDREYKYRIGTGFYLYPKNFDGKYRGIVTLHQALSNSLNVPTVKTLEFAGVDSFNNFLENTLQFYPRQRLENYDLGIALGGLEMDLLTLSNYFTIFPNEGVLKPLKITVSPDANYLQAPMSAKLSAPKKIIDVQFIKLVNGILTDRATGVDQFGLKSNLNLTQSNYAVKTGTTYDFHDSWTIGFTPDFLVGVWVGNSSNKAIRQITGQQGAGKIWHDAMELILNSPYNKKSEFNFDGLKEFDASGTLEYGLPNDNYAAVRKLLLDNALILEPHDGDVFAESPGATIPLHSREEAAWYVDGQTIGTGRDLSWKPSEGSHQIVAKTNSGREEKVKIKIVEDDSVKLP